MIYSAFKADMCCAFMSLATHARKGHRNRHSILGLQGLPVTLRDSKSFEAAVIIIIKPCFENVTLRDSKSFEADICF
jgi:hypothetical protein